MDIKTLLRILSLWLWKSPRYFFHLPSFLFSFKRATQKRRELLQDGLVVPPMLILSITQECNLACTGCYAAQVGTMKKGQPSYRPHLNIDQWRKIIKEAKELGVFFFLLAGGEPFLHPGILNLIKEFPGNFFLVFTNGVAVSKVHLAELKKLNNVAVILSLEGGEEETDSRRGRGVYKRVMETKAQLILGGTLAGVSVTITRRKSGPSSERRCWNIGRRKGYSLFIPPETKSTLGAAFPREGGLLTLLPKAFSLLVQSPVSQRTVFSVPH
ncbi:MAG: radical SAM protein [Caldiserica bacterium]|nr:radical SAM protein [Caldisericota bacterium]